MDWQFGYNCTHFVPCLDKCRVKIDRYNKRSDLLADRWLLTREVLMYTGWSSEELVERVERGEVAAKKVDKPINPERDGYLRSCLPCSWEWDDCSMAITGGVCEWYEPHGQAHIGCIADLRNWPEEHPNTAYSPSVEDWRLIEDRLCWRSVGVAGPTDGPLVIGGVNVWSRRPWRPRRSGRPPEPVLAVIADSSGQRSQMPIFVISVRDEASDRTRKVTFAADEASHDTWEFYVPRGAELSIGDEEDRVAKDRNE